MSLELNTSIEINANIEKVWQVFTDFESYPLWNPLISELDGDVEVGKNIKIVLPGMTFKPRILVYQKNKELKWLGHLLIKGLFDGEHRFELINNNGKTQFNQSEKFSGLLVPLFKKKLLAETKADFEEMNKALKHRVESIA